MRDMPDAPRRPPGLPIARLVAYALPAAPINAVDTPISVYLPAFYAGTGALSLSLIGTLILAARIVEIPLSLAAGAVSDAVGPQRWRRRGWMALAAPLTMLGLWRLFDPPPAPSAAWLLGWLLLVILGGITLYLNHVAWGSEAAGGYDERTRVQAVRQAASVAGLVLVLVPPILIERAHKAGQLADLDRARMAAIAAFFLILLPLSVGAALAFAPEGAAPARPRPDRPPAGALLKALAADRALRRLLLVDLLDSAAIGVVTSLFVFMARDVWGLGGFTSLMLLAYLACGLAGLGPILAAVRGRSKARAAAWIALAIAAALPGLALVPAHAAPFAFAAVLALGLPSAANTALFDSLMGDIAAADARASGTSRAGLYYALHMVTGRIGRGLAVAAAFAGLQAIGFHPGAANAPGVLSVFRLAYVAAPMALQIAMAVLLWRFPEPARDPNQD